ncbi:MAG: hypothetical protein ACOCSN_00125 [Halanaeroarchaeum sp.]
MGRDDEAHRRLVDAEADANLVDDRTQHHPAMTVSVEAASRTQMTCSGVRLSVPPVGPSGTATSPI